MVHNGLLHPKGGWRTWCALGLLFILPTVFFLFLRNRGETPPVYVVYTAIFETDAAIADTLSVGDTLIDARAKGEAGEILRITREPSLREDVHGVYTHPTSVTVALTLGAYGRATEKGVSVGGLVPRVGEALYLYGGARLEGLCVRVRAI